MLAWLVGGRGLGSDRVIISMNTLFYSEDDTFQKHLAGSEVAKFDIVGRVLVCSLSGIR